MGSVGKVVSKPMQYHKFTSLKDILEDSESNVGPPSHEPHTPRCGKSYAFLEVLQGCFQLDPEERLTPNLLLQHPFIVGTGETDDSPIAEACRDEQIAILG